MQPSYSGVLDVAGDAFKLVAADLRVFARQRVTFAFTGEDTGGPFRCEGTAVFAQVGFYVAAGVPVRCTRGGLVDIRFSLVREEDEECEVEGTWSDPRYVGSPWGFSGVLDRIKAAS